MPTGEEFLAIVKRGETDEVRAALETEPALANTRNAQGLSALMTALYNQQPKIADLIRAHATDVNIFEASAAGDKARVASLLAKDPSLAKATAPDGFGALGLAAFFGHDDVMKTLLEAGADPNVPSKNPMKVTPLHSAVANRDSERALKMARVLLSHAADVNVVQHGGWTPLQQAAAHGNIGLVKLLLERGADISAKADDGRNAVALAQGGNHQAVVDLLEKGDS
ncbi:MULTISPECIES: ankyrin repeat domain-containing protein [Bradyrhizobium]|uniref:ankyrin repeat domain-containing protein n=1 Tax=Bradyrhizobium TaxID=374 RepID=UPI0004063EDA|nr:MULTISPECIES: ankyrin repeat domain-containing protein [Bradyrhizobium]MBR1001959.1 ankyrin repeat domain-containing protein [Bradyrhizobium liaoningense]MCP1749187.1 ankyrin repeat protein [Bradyrhizobium japonicum]MCP1855161.1 ankyrin repeat protein [Bradyrhizobium japonicum]MCP1898090.1 ankyrin repeat protein [Bradyrhizobium japonicum]MCW2330977.1 ankyrin repeat protein [Bradyrhizobium japonicum]